MFAPETAFACIRTLAAGLRAGEFSSVELTEFVLERLERIGPALNAVVTVTRELALTQAERADRELTTGLDRGLLHGIPYGAKDLLATAGIPTSWGAAPYRHQVFDADATVVRRLREAGAVLAAKLAMVEIAGGFGYQQANASFTGPGLCPWNRKAWSGGSSSGSGAAVGGGLVPFAIGSETWGSIMTPAGFCGVSGLRPTYGRVSRHGAMALSWTMDKLGPMCRTADDCGLVLAAIAGPDPDDPTAVDRPYAYPENGAPLAKGGLAGVADRFRLATLKGALDQTQPEVAANFEAALDVLREVATFEEIELPDLPYGTVAGTIISAEMSAAFDGLISSGDVWELTAPEDRYGGYAPYVIPARDYLNAQRIRPHIQKAMDRVLEPFDALVVPTLPCVASPIEGSFREYFSRYNRTDVGGAENAAGIPAISVPNGFGERGLPTGLKFVGRAFDENRILAAARAYQERTDWHTRAPELA